MDLAICGGVVSDVFVASRSIVEVEALYGEELV
jgi:hypothetical protein